MQSKLGEFFLKQKNAHGKPWAFIGKCLLFDDLQHFHGASLHADAAGNTLGGSAFFCHNHDLHGAGFHALAALDAQLLVDHVHAGLGVLGDGAGFADLGALTALDADVGLGFAVLAFDDLDAAQGDIIGLIECFGAGLNTLQASHTSFIFLNSELLHVRILLLCIIETIISITAHNFNTKF